MQAALVAIVFGFGVVFPSVGADQRLASMGGGGVGVTLPSLTSQANVVIGGVTYRVTLGWPTGRALEITPGG